MTKKTDYYSLSFTGRRSNNEDSLLTLKLADDIFFFAVADGMGGNQSGELASNLVLSTAKNILHEEIPHINSSKDLKEILERIYLLSQNEIIKAIDNDPTLKGMGTTLVILFIYKGVYVWSNIGDSRLYSIRSEKTEKLTVDHTHVQEFINNSNAPLPKSVIDKYGTFLSKVLDGGNDTPDIYPFDKDYEQLKDGTIFLLCSDGLIDNKASSSYEYLTNYLLGIKDLKESAEQLIAYAYTMGSKDNITAVLFEYGKVQRRKSVYKKNPYPPSIHQLMNNK